MYVTASLPEEPKGIDWDFWVYLMIEVGALIALIAGAIFLYLNAH